jgi:Fur family iron response transcriptional regulator
MLRSKILTKFDECGILSTPQRIEIAEILLEKPQHLSADQIIDRLREKGSGVSKATVYNTLNLFTEHRLIRECIVDPERRFYDSTIEPHHHFYNVDSGELTDIPRGALRVEDLPEIPDGDYIESVEVVVKLRSKSAENPA